MKRITMVNEINFTVECFEENEDFSNTQKLPWNICFNFVLINFVNFLRISLQNSVELITVFVFGASTQPHAFVDMGQMDTSW